MVTAMFDWRLGIAWVGLASLGGVSVSGLAGPSTPAVAAPVATNAPPAGFITARRDSDGFFYVTLAINERPVRFLIDTGSSHMMLSSRDARKVGVGTAGTTRAAVVTVGGHHSARWARLDDVAVAGARIGKVDAVVLDDDLPASLLGQDILERLGRLRIDGDTLTIEGTSTR